MIFKDIKDVADPKYMPKPQIFSENPYVKYEKEKHKWFKKRSKGKKR